MARRAQREVTYKCLQLRVAAASEQRLSAPTFTLQAPSYTWRTVESALQRLAGLNTPLQFW